MLAIVLPWVALISRMAISLVSVGMQQPTPLRWDDRQETCKSWLFFCYFFFKKNSMYIKN
jgi:hypothetical protein